MYRIEIHYSTGNSFGIYETYEYLSSDGWSSLEICEKNLQRIKKHYEWFLNQEKLPKPEFTSSNGYSLYLFVDNGSEYSIRPFWIGYFERLYGAKIVIENNNEMEFTI